MAKSLTKEENILLTLINAFQNDEKEKLNHLGNISKSLIEVREKVKEEMEKLENEIKELEKSIEELENIYKNRKNSELENKYIKIFREKLPELEDKYYYFGENSITTNSINFIPFKYLKPYFEGNIKTKEQFYKLINFENEK